MSHRLTVAKVRKMDDGELYHSWENACYPFDRAKKCGACLTLHIVCQPCECPSHRSMRKELPLFFESTMTNYIRKHLVKLFSLRRKYARFYPKVKP